MAKWSKWIEQTTGVVGGVRQIRASLMEQSKYGTEKLRELRSERGVGPMSRVDIYRRVEVTNVLEAANG